MDGKTIRGSRSESRKACHVVSASMAEDQVARARKDLSPLDLNVLRKVALTLCRNTDLGKRVSLQKKRFRASLDPETFLSILLGRS